MIDPGRERRFAGAFGFGVVLFVLGIGLLLLFTIGGIFLVGIIGPRAVGTGVVISGLVTLTSLLMMGVTLFRGIGVTSKLSKSQEKMVLPNSVILACFAYDASGQMCFPSEVEADLMKEFWVRLTDERGVRYELKTAAPVFFECGEGMRVDAHIQGNWLSMVVPHVGRTVEVPKDPFSGG